MRLPPWFPQEGANAPLIQAIQEALPQKPEEAVWETLDLNRAEGAWLDVHAKLYGLQRLPGEDDEALRSRIRAIFVPRNTLGAIRRALEVVYGPGQAEVRENPSRPRRTYWYFPVADGLLDAGFRTWPKEQAGGERYARLAVSIRGRPIPPGGKDPVLEVMRPAGVALDVEYLMLALLEGHALAREERRWRSPTAGEAWVANGYLAFGREGALLGGGVLLEPRLATYPVADERFVLGRGGGTSLSGAARLRSHLAAYPVADGSVLANGGA